MQGADPEFEKCVFKGRGGGGRWKFRWPPSHIYVFYCQIMIFWQFITSDVWTFYFLKKRAGPP